MARKKTYACGHRGKGSFCQVCRTQATPPETSEQTEGEDDKQRWRAAFESDPIDLQHLPNKSLVRRARMILDAVGSGAPWHQFNGKRLQHDRNVVSVPLGRRYRILFRTDEGSPEPVSVMSHESYNGTKPGRR